jgi:hypothetical protein
MNYKMTEVGKPDSEYNRIINAIHSIQQNEKYMYERIAKINSAPVYDSQEKQNIIDQLKSLQVTRNSLYSTLVDMYKNKSNSIKEDEFELKNGVKMVKMMNEELDTIKDNIDRLEADEQKKERVTQMKNYEQKKYRFILNLIKIVAYLFVSILVIIICQYFFLPQPIAVFLYVIVVSIGSISIFYRLYDMNMRNNINFDKYDWSYNKKLDEEQYVPIETDNMNSKKKTKCSA